MLPIHSNLINSFDEPREVEAEFGKALVARAPTRRGGVVAYRASSTFIVMKRCPIARHGRIGNDAELDDDGDLRCVHGDRLVIVLQSDRFSSGHATPTFETAQP